MFMFTPSVRRGLGIGQDHVHYVYAVCLKAPFRMFRVDRELYTLTMPSLHVADTVVLTVIPFGNMINLSV